MDIKGLKTALPICFKSNLTMLIVGQHGVGKSQGVRQVVEGQGLGKVFDFRLGQMADTGDIIGLLDIENSSDYCQFKIPKRIYEVEQYCLENPDKYGVMFFDEMNRTTKDILQAIFQIVLDHELNGRKFPTNMKAVAAINPATEDYSVLDFDDKAFADRFCHVKFEPSVSDWLDYATNKGLDSSITSFIGEYPNALKCEAKDFTLQVEPSPRSWFFVNEVLKNCKDVNIFQELLIGLVGIEFATSFIEYRTNFKDSIDVNDLLNDYEKVRQLVITFSANESNRSDILSQVCSQLKCKLEEVEVLSLLWESNLVNFLIDIPRDLSFGLQKELFSVPSFGSTESDKESGLFGGNSDVSKRLIEHFKGWNKENSNE
jgi:hypothetical protein